MSAQPEPWRTLSAEIKKLREQTRALANRSPFFGTGIHPTGVGGMASDSFDGNLATRDAGTTGWAFDDSHVAVGDLILRPGSIGNDTLAHPIQADINGNNGIGSSVSTTSTSMATTTLTCPAGFTSALVRADAVGEAVNTTASPDYLYVMASIQGIGGGEVYNSAASGFGVSGIGIANRLVTGLSGGSVITADVMSRTGFASWSANAANLWTIHLQVIWLR